MTAEARRTAVGFLGKNKYLLLVLLAGLVLILLPDFRGDDKEAETEETATVYTQEEERLAGALSRMVGVGDVYVLLSEGNDRGSGYAGAVIVCRGADDAGVRLRIVEAVSAFTGLGSNKIIVLKMKS